VSNRDLAYIYLALGNSAEALDLFEQAIGERDPAVVWIGVDPRLDGLRPNPRFRQLVQTVGLPRTAVGVR
jgi:hypothetical protein